MWAIGGGPDGVLASATQGGIDAPAQNLILQNPISEIQ